MEKRPVGRPINRVKSEVKFFTVNEEMLESFDKFGVVKNDKFATRKHTTVTKFLQDVFIVLENFSSVEPKQLEKIVGTYFYNKYLTRKDQQN